MLIGQIQGRILDRRSEFHSKLIALLPAPKVIKVRTGVDRYGFSHVLARRLNLCCVPRAFGNWVHGWSWSTKPTAETLLVSDNDKDTSIVVRNEIERDALVVEGYCNVKIGGLPFGYVPAQHKYRSEGALLAFPPHSAESAYLATNQLDYFDFLESIKVDFDGVYVSIHFIDMHKSMHEAAVKRGFHVIEGARPDDANSLMRVRTLLDGFKYVTSNVMGSHMIYALYAGCKFSFCGPFYEYNHSFNFTHSDGQPKAVVIDNSIAAFSKNYVGNRFANYFLDHPLAGIENIEFARTEIGEHFIMQPDALKTAVGWDIPGQIIGYTKVASRKLRRVVSSMSI